MNPFQALGIPEDSTEQLVLKAWRALALKYHPDKETGDDTKMRDLNSAKEACLDAILNRGRSEFDIYFTCFECPLCERIAYRFRQGSCEANACFSAYFYGMSFARTGQNTCCEGCGQEQK